MRALILSSIVSLSLAGAAIAAPATTTTPASAKPAATAHKGGVAAADRSAISKSCSSQADAKNLHGKPRQKFRRACMKGK